MAYRTATVSEMVGRVAHMLTNDATPDSTLKTEIKWALEDTLNDLCFRSDLAAFRKEGLVNTSKNTRDYELPDDFYRLVDPAMKFRDDPYWTLTWFDQQDFDRIDGDWRFQNTSRPRHYTVRGRDEVSGRYILRLAPVPDASYPMSVNYFAIPSRIATADDTDSLDKRFPPMFWRAVQLGAAIQFPQYLTPSQRQGYEAHYARSVMRIMETQNPVTGRVHQVRKYAGAPKETGATWNLTGTDILDPNGNSV